MRCADKPFVLLPQEPEDSYKAKVKSGIWNLEQEIKQNVVFIVVNRFLFYLVLFSIVGLYFSRQSLLLGRQKRTA